ncbi:MAG TPA: hypothetical protein VN678_00810, partial [Acidobacteriaceae bacterium]|nr:hypothetical protein [Acidobacteriaceae bacterium]
IDTTSVPSSTGAQQEGDLDALLAFQIAHIILDHRLDTKYAFNDRLLFPSDSVFQHVPMHHTDSDNEAAAKKAMELLNAKELADKQQYFGLYLQQLQAREKGLTALETPMIGDSLVKSEKDPTFWMAAMIPKGIKLDMKDLKQQAAMPLASFLRFDPWNDQVVQMHTSLEPIINERDKMPFEVEPVYMKLTYYALPAAPAAPAAGAANTPASTPQQGDPAAAPVGQPGAATADTNTAPPATAAQPTPQQQ